MLPFPSSVIDVARGLGYTTTDSLFQNDDLDESTSVSKTTPASVSTELAIELTRKRLGTVSGRVHWLVADITDTQMDHGAYDVWRDRAYFTF